MSAPLARVTRVARLDFLFHLQRPLILMLILAVLFSAWGLSSGNMSISSGDATVGGKKAWITSEHSNALGFCYLTLLLYAFFASVAAGTSITRDDELRVGEVLHTTGLRPREYVWGKFWGVLASLLVVLLVQIVATMLCQHLLPIDDAAKIRGPFALANYLRPVLFFALPTLVFLTGIAFWLGERTRRPVSVFLFPVGLLGVVGFFLWDFKPSWLDPRIDRALMWIDPTGYRWLEGTHLRIDRGTDYYNTQPVHFEWQFLLSRLAFIVAGLAAVAWSARRFERVLRGRLQARKARVAREALTAPREAPETKPLAPLAMRAGSSSFLGQLRGVARFEVAGLVSSAGLYLFAPLILLQAIGTAFYNEGIWGTKVIVTSGGFAVDTFNTLTLCTVLLLLFYTVEALDRERSTGLQPIYASTRVPTAAIVLGKALANCFVGLVILVAAGVGAAIIMLAQGRTRPEIVPFALVWGGLLVPTLFVWSSFVMAVFALVRSKYATYGIALGVLVLTGVLQARGKMNWVLNWNLWSTTRWTDMGILEPNGLALLLNRALVVACAVLFAVFAVKMIERREWDAAQSLHRLSPGRLARAGLRFLPYAIPPAAIAIALGYQVLQGFQGKERRREERDYWKQNLATWKDAPRPGMKSVDLEVSLEPRRHWFKTRGAYTLYNPHPDPMREIALTLGRHVRSATWTMNAAEHEPENRSNLFVFALPAPLAPGDSVQIGFEFEGRLPDGVTKNGGGAREFIEPSGVVLTSFRPTFVPLPFFDEETGVDPKENQYEPRVFPTDYWQNVVPPPFGLHRPFRTRIRIDAPQEYRLNSVGQLVEETVVDGRRRALWVSDHPVNFYNIVAGRWMEERGDGTVIYHHPQHRYNIAEMRRALDGSRRFFSEWFYPYPWQELKLSQFANLATYAQGFPTNITFSEGIGFLTMSDPRTRMAFMVTAHEAAHQWWGNLLVPGDGPGGDILSEGMAHFSTLLLNEEMNGPQGRMEFAKRIEERYGDDRQVDAERPLVRIDGSKQGDRTVMYDKGGWVFWMLHDMMGEEANLAGLRAFLRNHLDNPDHPQLEDFVEEMRPYAPDPAAYEAFTRQWFFEVVAPEFVLEDVERTQADGGWIVTGTVRNSGTGRVPVEIAATHGDRFVEQTEEEAMAGPATISPDYREARAVKRWLAAGETSPFEIRCDFEPELALADPDVRVLQLRRKYALHRF